MKMPSNLIQLRIVAFSLVLIIVPFFAYYYFFVSNQTKYINGRNLRTLNTLSTHVQESVESQSSVFKNAVKKYVAVQKLDKAGQAIVDDTQPVTSDQPKQKDATALFQEKALDPFKGDNANLQVASLTVVSKPADETLLDAPRIELKEESSQRWLYFEYTIAYTPAEAKPTAPAESPQLGYLNFKAKINFADLVSPFVNDRELQERQGALNQDGFDAVLIAGLDDQMTILFQESSAKLRMLSLDNLTSSTGGKVDLRLLGQSTNISDVRVGPVDYKLFVQPIQIPLLKVGADKQVPLRWLACGLVENLHFQEQRLAINYNVLIAFGFITVLVAVSWWFLKLLFIGPKDRFRARDAYKLAFSAFMIAALLTLAALFYYSYNATLSAGQNNLEQFAGTLKDNFNTELENALAQIDDLNEKLPYSTIAAAKEGGPRELDKLARSSIWKDQTVTPKSPYPYLSSAFWLDELGWQQIKWTMRSSVTNRVNLSDRAYFLRLRQGRHYDYKGHEFWIEPVTSKTTGANTVVIAKRMVPEEPRSWIAALDTKLVSLMQPVIPEGFGYAVIDENGKVLFHSAAKLHLGENFFEECDNNQLLRAAVLGRWKQSLTSSYFGKGNSLYVEPLEALPWTIIAFHEKDSLRTTFSETLGLCLVLFFIYVVVLSLLLAAIWLGNRFSQDRSTWLWPDRTKRALYVHSTQVNATLFLLSCIAVYILPGLWKLFLPAAIGLTAIALSVWRFKRTKVDDKKTGSKWFDYRTAYIVNVTLLFCLASVLPAYASFRIAYVEEMKLFIKQGQLSLANDVMAREERIRREARTTYRYVRNGLNENQQNEHLVTALIQKRIKEERDVYAKFFFDSRQEQRDALPRYTNTRPSRLLHFAKGFVPLFDPSSINRHALTTPADDNSRGTDGSSGTTLVLHAREPQRNSQKPLERRIQSTLPTLQGGPWWWVLLPLVFVAVSLLVLYMIRQLFPFALKESAPDELSDFCADSGSQNLLVVLGPNFMGKSQLLQRMKLNAVQRIDIEHVSRLKRWGRLFDRLSAGGGPIVLDNFEYGLDNSQETQQKLDLLETLRQKERPTIALSMVQPEGLWSPKAKNGHTNGNGAKNGDSNGDSAGAAPVPLFSNRWTSAASRFLQVSPEDLGDADSFQQELETYKQRLLAGPDLDSEAKKRIVSAFAFIKQECSPRAYLQNVGLAIARQSRLAKVSTATVCKQIVTNARPYYTAIWNSCTGEQKLTLTRLAQHGLLSPKDPDTEELINQGLIVSHPAMRLMNRSFRLFILTIGTDNALAQCEKDAKSSSNWEVLKVPLTIGLLSVAAFLLLTQRELYNSALPFITGLAAGLPSLLKLVSLFQSGAGAKAGS